MPTKQLPPPPADIRAQLSDEYPYEFAFVPYSQLILDTVEGPVGKVLGGDVWLKYQRYQTSVAKRINRDGFQKLLFMPLVLNRRKGGFYAIGDGGGRFLAVGEWIKARALPKSQRVPSLVTTLPAEEEPLWFVKLNREKLGLSQVDVFLANASAGDPETTDVIEIVSAQGMKVQAGGAPRTIQAVQALLSVHRRLTGREDLRRTLSLIRRSGWVDRPKGLTGAAIVGVGMIVQLHNPEHTDEYLLQALAEITPQALYHDSIRTTPAGGGSRLLGKGFAYVLADHVNKVHRAKRSYRRYIDKTQFFVDREVEEEDVSSAA